VFLRITNFETGPQKYTPHTPTHMHGKVIGNH
jgi:hypothetical protein